MLIVVILLAVAAAIFFKTDGVHRASEADSEFAGVCAGIAQRYEFNITAVRVLWVLWSLCVGGGVITYLVLWMVLPQTGPNHLN
jgi:phage shock protein PspC (stress-responsive transcriptional regulator)